jgi:hypothetical protein
MKGYLKNPKAANEESFANGASLRVCAFETLKPGVDSSK